MTVIPGSQDAATFMGGGYTQPQMLNAQIPGAPQLPQLSSPTNYQPQSLNTPQSNPANAALLNAVQNATPNSAVNHSYGNGGWSGAVPQNVSSPAPMQPAQNNNPGIYGGMFGNGR